MDETIDDAASQEQPALDAVSDETPVEATIPLESAPAAPVAEPAFPTRLYAAKYQSADELERAYLDSQREASRMAGELSALKRTESPAATVEPKWKQLDAERNKWAQQLRSPSLDEQQRWQADEQVRLYDREIAYERAKHDIAQQSTRSTAESSLERDSQEIFTQYEADLNNPQSALFQAAASRYQQLVSAGYPDSINTKALAVTYVAVKSGTGTAKAIQNDRSALLKTLNQNVKKAVVAGNGGPMAVKSNGVGAREISQMSDAEFAKYERTLLGV